MIERVLGEGGFGITYCAKDHKTGGLVAVKEYFPDSMATRNNTSVVPHTGESGEFFSYGKQCFIEEANTLAQFIGNENIVRIYCYFEENGTAYFVMDYVEGVSFDAYIRNRGGKLSYEDTARILIPVMDALSLVHSRGIIHRDITPDNIYITNSGNVKILDFGAARYSLGDKSQSLDVVLKHGFAPKEQYVRHGRQGPFTDVYSLGATFYFALTGTRPQDSVERMDVDKLVPPSSFGVAITKEAENAIMKALSVQPSDRFQNMQAFRNAIGQVKDGNEQPVVQRYFTSPAEQSSSQSDSRPQEKTISPDACSSGLPVDKSSLGSIINGKIAVLNSAVEKNFKLFKIAAIILFAIDFIIDAYSNVPYLSDFDSYNKALLLTILVANAVLVAGIIKNNNILLLIGLAARLLELILWLKISTDRIDNVLLLLNAASVVLMAIVIFGKSINTLYLYILGIASLLYQIVNLNHYKVWGFIENIAYIMLIILIAYRYGGKNHGTSRML
ncbi:MAG: serine/threonine protein kinase [Butyrivibrio sp.]|uniref:serine/threonine protein kinase n=1 Tax=Butyrivibrio sp. TaxID=28121 RepID=UPI001B167712|nr:serine/threonine-protein kinase [Butyrivibrio sp.]MBO6239519.1 serine/threonine protein kinase [Butyrivibrio sp.]